MTGIPQTLYNQLRQTLLTCDELYDFDQLRALFAVEELRPFRNRLKNARSSDVQVALLISDLFDSRRATGENALVIFLQVLVRNYEPGDARHADLLELALQLQNALTGSVSSKAVSKPLLTESGTVAPIRNEGGKITQDQLGTLRSGEEPASDGRHLRPLSTAQVKTSIEIQHRYALLVGVRDYVDPNFRPLPHTVHDVVAIEKVLTAAGYTARCLHSDQTDDKLKPTRDNIWGELENLAAQTGPGDLLLVHFGGHGHLQDNKAYLITSQTRHASLQRTAIDLDEFSQTLTNAPAQARILILDACHSGIGRSATGMDPDFERHVYLEAEGTATLAACSQQQVAYEHDQSPHGAFTYFLLEGLRGVANKGQQFVTFSALNFYVTDQVKRWAIRKGLQQTPNAITYLVGDPPLVVLSDAQTLLLQHMLDVAPSHTTEQSKRSLVAQVGDTIQRSLQNQGDDVAMLSTPGKPSVDPHDDPMPVYKSVLIVDSSKEWQNLLLMYITRVGDKHSFTIDIHFADSLPEATRKTIEQVFDLIISEIRLEDYGKQDNSGLEFIRNLRTRGIDSKILILTGYATNQITREAFVRLNVSDVIEKSLFDSKSFSEYINDIINSKSIKKV